MRHQNQTPTVLAPSADELLLQSVEDFRERMRAVESRGREEHIEAISDAQKKIKYADQFVRRAGLDSALLGLMKEMWHWPAWIRRRDFKDHCRVELAELSADEIQPNDRVTTKRIGFRVGDHSYRFEFDEDRSWFDESKWGEIRLYCTGDLVVSTKIVHWLDVDQECDDWNYHSATALKPGPWIGPIIELEHEFRRAKQKWFDDIEAKRLKEQAQGLPDAK
jgi:hypothetical protein